jgi:hypothetical protein
MADPAHLAAMVLQARDTFGALLLPPGSSFGAAKAAYRKVRAGCRWRCRSSVAISPPGRPQRRGS